MTPDPLLACMKQFLYTKFILLKKLLLQQYLGVRYLNGRADTLHLFNAYE